MASKMATNCIQDLGEDVTRKGLHCTWIDERDWKTVCAQLYSSRAAERQRGVARVSAWRARGVVPFPVEITADIIDSQLLDEQQQSTLLTEQPLALLYSMVVTRWESVPDQILILLAVKNFGFGSIFVGLSMEWLIMGFTVAGEISRFLKLCRMYVR